jgi:hypothetical protein
VDSRAFSDKGSCSLAMTNPDERLSGTGRRRARTVATSLGFPDSCTHSRHSVCRNPPRSGHAERVGFSACERFHVKRPRRIVVASRRAVQNTRRCSLATPRTSDRSICLEVDGGALAFRDRAFVDLNALDQEPSPLGDHVIPHPCSCLLIRRCRYLRAPWHKESAECRSAANGMQRRQSTRAGVSRETRRIRLGIRGLRFTVSWHALTSRQPGRHGRNPRARDPRNVPRRFFPCTDVPWLSALGPLPVPHPESYVLQSSAVCVDADFGLPCCRSEGNPPKSDSRHCGPSIARRQDVRSHVRSAIRGSSHPGLSLGWRGRSKGFT